MNKARGANGTASVTFSLPAVVGASHVAVCGDWNDWSPEAHVLDRVGDEFTLTILLEAGRAYRFRYFLDGHRWENDWAADAYVPNDHGGDDSLVDLTALVDEVPAADAPAKRPVRKTTAAKGTPAAKKTTAKKTPAAKKTTAVKKTTAAKTATPAKQAAAKKTGAATAAAKKATATKAAAKKTTATKKATAKKTPGKTTD